ncbi:MAG TPA: tetratricopeptide repeat protein [Blastocatellia bacterium]|nr:tetratricopeptide repeat protein [Blastocatellia bacterium]
MSLNKSKVLRSAEKYVLQGKLPAAIDEYRKVVDADPSDLTTINTLGDLYVRAGRIQDAINNFSRIADSYREGGFTLKAIAMLKKISKLDPTNVETAMKLANLYSQQGLLVEARQQYLQVADAYARKGETRKALEAYQKIADLDPSNTSVRIKLGEIYAREGFTEQAHESFILAGSEFLRKGDTEQALNANLKAISIKSDSMQALTAIATIYTQHGQIDRAINLLCDAFERNPGDVELLTILGRTYLQAGMMDDAERTFLSLVELDRNRYHYLLEVGRRFLQMGDLDRAAEQIDGCLDVLIAKREEDKAIDFLRKILDRDMNHVGGLKRLAQIFLRIREDHNVIATLNSLVEAAMRKGDDEAAIEALKELARMEPDEPMHLQRLYTLGVKDIVESDAPDVIRATGPLDYGAAAFDDAFVIRQISEAEILAGHGQVTHAVEILTGILQHAPENVQVHLKLKDIYLRAGQMDKAALECLELSRIHDGRGESARSSDYVAEARQLNPLLDTEAAEPAPAAAWGDEANNPFAFHSSPTPTNGNGAEAGKGSDAFNFSEPSEDIDWSRYQTGLLHDHAGFVTAPEQAASGNGASAALHASDASVAALAEPEGFRYSDTLVGESSAHADDSSSESMSRADGGLSDEEASGVLRDELEGIDFYIAQGYVEIAQDTLERLRKEYGPHPEVMARFKQMGLTGAGERSLSEPTSPPAAASAPEESYANSAFEAFLNPSASGPADSAQGFSFSSPAEATGAANGNGPAAEIDLSMFVSGSGALSMDAPLVSPLPPFKAPEPARDNGDSSFHEGVSYTGSLVGKHLGDVALNTFEQAEEEKAEPFMIHKDTGPLNPDLIVKFNTSDLLHNTMFDAAPSAASPVAPAGTGELIDSLVSDIDASFDNIQQASEEDDGDVPAPSSPFSLAGESEMPQAYDEPALASAADASDGENGFAFNEPDAPLGFDPDYAISPTAITAMAGDGEAVGAKDTASWGGDLFAETTAQSDLHAILEELREETGPLEPTSDFETHYSLGLAYKDMDLLDDAIGEFQRAFRLAGSEDVTGDYIQCCNMLGVCFKRKQLPKVAIMWFERGLKIPNRTEDEYQALRYEIGMCYEELGELDKALDVFMDVYGSDVNYRETAAKIRRLQAAKSQ